MPKSIKCSKCGKYISFNTKDNCYQLRLGYLESADEDFHAHEDVGYYHRGCI